MGLPARRQVLSESLDVSCRSRECEGLLSRGIELPHGLLALEDNLGECFLIVTISHGTGSLRTRQVQIYLMLLKAHRDYE